MIAKYGDISEGIFESQINVYIALSVPVKLNGSVPKKPLFDLP
jgi:hypothetical protein